MQAINLLPVRISRPASIWSQLGFWLVVCRVGVTLHTYKDKGTLFALTGGENALSEWIGARVGRHGIKFHLIHKDAAVVNALKWKEIRSRAGKGKPHQCRTCRERQRLDLFMQRIMGSR
jgi:hypothetical protein